MPSVRGTTSITSSGVPSDTAVVRSLSAVLARRYTPIPSVFATYTVRKMVVSGVTLRVGTLVGSEVAVQSGLTDIEGGIVASVVFVTRVGMVAAGAVVGFVIAGGMVWLGTKGVGVLAI